MELFLSYSRQDSAMGDRLRTDLEAAGHSVWLDRDDIRGGEQWRTSIAQGIGNADRVVLLVSPRSMASENVGRELSLAEDLEKPILPLRIEPTDVPAGFQYLLAGIHYIEFEGRPYQTALDELLEDLSGARADKPPSAPWVPVGAGPRGGPAWLKYAAAAVVVVGLILIFRPDSSVQSSTTLSAGPATTSATSSTTRTYELGGSAWLGGVKFSPTKATYEAETQNVKVSHQAEVRQTETRQWFDLYPSMVIELADGTQIPMSGDSGQVPGLSTSTVEFTYCCALADVDLSTAALVFGKPTEQRWTLPMAPDAVGTGPEPVHIDVDDRVMAEGLYFDMTDIDLVPWSCSAARDGYPQMRGTTTFTTVGEDRLTVVITGTLGADQPPPGGTYPLNVTLTQPNGNATAAIGSYTTYGNGDSATQVPMCFLVDAPGSGTYTLNWSSYHGGQDTFEFTLP